MLSQLGFFFEMDSSRLLAVLVSNSMEAFPIVCYCIVLVKKSSFCLTLTQLKKQQQHMNFHFQVRTKQNKNVFQSHCSMEKKQFPNPFQIQSGQFLSHFQDGKRPFYAAKSIHFLCQSWGREACAWVSSRGGMAGMSPSLGVLLSQQLFGDAIPMKLHYGVPLSINLSALQCPQQSLI